MSDEHAPPGEGPYLFDVDVTTLAHAGTPVSEKPLSYVRQAIAGEIDAIVPYASLVGTHHMLVSAYGFSTEEATAVIHRFVGARRVHWTGSMNETVVREGLRTAATLDVDGWDGYHAQVAKEEGVETILTTDDDLSRIDGVRAEVVLSTEEFERLNEFLGY